MRKMDWIVAISFMGLGIMCMTVAAISFLEHPSVYFFRTLITICLWLGIPFIILGSSYYLLIKKRKHR